LDDLNYYIARTDWRDPDAKEAKQAELLIEGSFPWDLIEAIGVMDQPRQQEATNFVRDAAHRPRVAVERSWYY